MQLTDIIKPECIVVPLKAADKHTAIDELVDLLAERGRIQDPDELKKAVWQRETTRTTGIGHGLAIPHGKAACCDRLVMAIGKPAEPIEFNSIDGRPVRLIFLLASPPDQTGAHIQALASISRLMTRDQFRSDMLNASDAQSIYDQIVSAETAAAK
ncbi:PTS sugar transporter subunit IIA [Planctomycetales bacterium ZRK34]|nr:PTS sugar transporter subunit IIA [Planctomycetales bacterium ZRK34]